MTFRSFDASGMVNKNKSVSAAGLNVALVAANDQKTEAMGTPIGIVFHWTAGDYVTCYDDYHFCIAFDVKAQEPVIVRMLNWKNKGKHIWGYNTGMVGISFCAMADGVMLDSTHMRAVNYPVPAACIEAAATLAAEICAWKAIDPFGTITLDEKIVQGSSLVATGKTIDVPTILDHAYMAKKCGYFPERWDVQAYYPRLVNRAQAVYKELKGAPMPGGGKRSFFFESLLK